MTAEQIERAIRRGWVEHHIGNQVQTDEDVDGFNPLPSANFREGFIAGAEWRINSVWHNVEEEPEQNAWFIAQIGGCFFDTFVMAVESNRWKRWCKGMNIKRWAYIEDLLPERKEDAE